MAGGVNKIRKNWLHKTHLMGDEISREPHKSDVPNTFLHAMMNKMDWDKLATLLRD